MRLTPAPLSTVRDYLATRYRAELGQSLGDGQTASIGAPAWRLVRAVDLRSPAEPNSHDVAGVLLDAELGLVLFFLPYAAGCDVRTQARAAASLQESLGPLSSPNPPPDDLGSWQVALHWLVEAADRASWEADLAQLRQATALAEELSLDALFYTPGQLEAKLEEHGLPRLWFTARQVLAQTGPHEAAQWLSADRAVLRELEGFPEEFTDLEQRRRAELIQDQLGEVVLTVQGEAAESPRELSRLEVRDFRNLGHVQLHFGLAPVSCRVIHGPNGTGKTSLCEALCLALYGSSPRYRQFLSREERNVASGDRSRLYAQQYLTPLGTSTAEPHLGLNGAEPTPPTLVKSWEEASRIEREFSGNVLAQGTGQEFLGLSAEELASRVLAGYSEFAERLENFVEQRVEAATQRRQGFLRGLGLSSSITRITTALASLAEQTLQREFSSPAPSLPLWLDHAAEIPCLTADAESLRADWRAAADAAEQVRLAERFGGGTEPEATALLTDWLEHRNTLTRQTRELAERLDERLAPLREHHDATLRDLTAWGEWLERRPASLPPSAAPAAEAEALQRKLAAIQTAQQKAMKDGQAVRQQLDHLEQVNKLIGQGLLARAPHRCPTCGADHAAPGGAAGAIAQLRAEVAARREGLLGEYRTLEAQAKALQGSLQARGESVCPLADARRAALQEALAWLLPAASPGLAAHLKDPAQRSRLLTLLKAIQVPPQLLSEVNAAAEAQRIARALFAQFAEARDMFFDQDHWKPVQAAFRKKLAKVVAEHLPATLQRLWVELSLNLTSAPWLLPARPVFAVALKRGQRQASVHLEDRLARYVLNQAETHLLGLGWFFTRYLVHGRFKGHFLILDDPAPELDETSYRELCRLWRVLLRLHAVRQQPLRLVLFLHQQERARAAARATHGLVVTLGWAREQQGTLRELEVFAPHAKPAQPTAWFPAEPAVA
jgi:hypothetical protein